MIPRFEEARSPELGLDWSVAARSDWQNVAGWRDLLSCGNFAADNDFAGRRTAPYGNVFRGVTTPQKPGEIGGADRTSFEVQAIGTANGLTVQPMRLTSSASSARNLDSIAIQAIFFAAFQMTAFELPHR